MASDSNEYITLVSGLPRSGTSMMMRMLEAGGLPILTDALREADENNPNGYYEFERVKALREGDLEWLDQARGKVIKVISFLLQDLPPAYSYRVIFMKREMQEILNSQRKMLEQRGQPADPARDRELATVFQKHLKQVETWLAHQPNIQTIYVSYNDLLKTPQADISRLHGFLGVELDEMRMVGTIDKQLYRQRAS